MGQVLSKKPAKEKKEEKKLLEEYLKLPRTREEI